MTRTSSISGTFVNRQRSPVRVAAASSLRAAFLAPLIGTVPCSGRPPSTRNTSRATGSGRYSQWNGRASAIGRLYAAVPRTLAVPPLGDADPEERLLELRLGRRPGRRRLVVRRPRAPVRPRAAPPAPSRGRSRWPGRRSRPSRRPCRAGPAGSRRRSRTTPRLPPLRMRSSPTPSIDTQRRVVRQHAELALAPGRTTASTVSE